MNRPASLQPHTRSFETLEPRQMLSGIPQWDDVSLGEKNIAAAAAAVMRGAEQMTLGTESRTILQTKLATDELLATIPAAAKEFIHQQSELETAEAKTSVMRDHVTVQNEVKTRLGTELTQKRSLLTEAQTLLQSCQVAESGLVAEQQSLAALVTTLQTELQRIPAQITALNQQIALDQKTLTATIAQRKQTEKVLTTVQNSYNNNVLLHKKFADLLIRYPQNKTYQFQHVLAHRNMTTLEARIQSYQEMIASRKAKEDGLNATLLVNRTEVSRLNARLPVLPAEIQSAKDQETVAQATLTSNRAEQGRLQTEITNRQSAVDTAITAESDAATHLTQDEVDLTELLAREQSERADVQLMYETVNTAIAQVVAEGDPVLPENDPDPVVIPQEKTGSADLGTTSRENEWTKLTLPSIGGDVLLRSWQGEAAGSVALETVSGEAIRQTVIAASLTANVVNQTPALTSQLNLVSGPQPDPAMGFALDLTRNVPGIGNLFLRTDEITPWYRGKPQERFIVNTQGMIVSSGLSYVGTTLRFDNPGCGKVEIAFPDGPRYVQWIDVRRTSGTSGGILSVTRADGTVSQIPFSSDGPVIVDGIISGCTMQPNSETGWGVKAMQCAEPQVNAEPGATWLRSRGELVGIDVSRMGKAVDQVSLDVLSDRPSSPLTAVAYRGNVKIASLNVGQDGLINFADAQGITSVLCIQSDPNATLTITNLSVQALDPSVAPPSTGLTPLENPDVAFHSSTVSDTETFNFVQVAQNAGVSFNRGGYANSVNGSMLFYNGGANDPTSYTMHKPLSADGSIGIGAPLYVTPTGLKPVPSTHWQFVGSGIVIFPGAPRYIVDPVCGHGSFDVAVTSGVSPTEIMPSTDMDLKTSVLVVRPLGPAEGWGDVPACVSSENAHATAGGTVNMFYQVMNDGLGSGQVTARIHIGQTGTADDPVVKEFTTTMNGLANKSLSVNVTLQADNDRATLEVIGPNGESSLAGWMVRPPHGDGGYTDEQRNYIMTEGRGVWLAAKINTIVANSTSPQIVAYREAVEANKQRLANLAAAEQAAEQARLEEEQKKIAEAIIDKLEVADLGTGGDDASVFIWDPEGGQVMTGGDLPLYNSSGFIPEGVDTTSGLGKIFTGFVQKLLPHAYLMATHPTGQEAKGIAFDPNFDSFYNYIHLAGDEIGIPWDRVLDAADISPTVADQATARTKLVNNLMAVFIEYGHGAIFESNDAPMQDYSTLPDTLENRERREEENAILNQLVANFPLNLEKGWKNTIGSPYHLGNARNAIDLNMLSGGNTDYGQPIISPSAGTIIGQPNVSIGAITVEYVIQCNGQPVTWRMRYLHLPLEEENGKIFVRQRENMNPEGNILFEKELSNGLTLNANEQFAVVGNNGTVSSHLHLETLDSQGRMIDLRRLFEPDHLNVPSRAADDSGREWAVTWDNSTNAWTNAEQGIIFVQDGNSWSDGENNTWVALHAEDEQRGRVIWKKTRWTDESGIIQEQDIWVDFLDPSKAWDGESRQWKQLRLANQ